MNIPHHGHRSVSVRFVSCVVRRRSAKVGSREVHEFEETPTSRSRTRKVSASGITCVLPYALNRYECSVLGFARLSVTSLRIASARIPEQWDSSTAVSAPRTARSKASAASPSRCPPAQSATVWSRSYDSLRPRPRGLEPLAQLLHYRLRYPDQVKGGKVEADLGATRNGCSRGNKPQTHDSLEVRRRTPSISAAARSEQEHEGEEPYARIGSLSSSFVRRTLSQWQ